MAERTIQRGALGGPGFGLTAATGEVRAGATCCWPDYGHGLGHDGAISKTIPSEGTGSTIPVPVQAGELDRRGKKKMDQVLDAGYGKRNGDEQDEYDVECDSRDVHEAEPEVPTHSKAAAGRKTK